MLVHIPQQGHQDKKDDVKATPQITEADLRATRKRNREEAKEGYMAGLNIALFFPEPEKLLNDMTQTDKQAKDEQQMDDGAKRRQTKIAEHFEFSFMK